ncbi:hypothetical protein MCG44_00750 [Lawsonibacter sp. OA9]|uniref:hypothetical protein n=1 Tax=Oscillospiraceae TaxID=216572 RepID=UPI001F06A45B|nr:MULTISPECIES: hypothetical protein [Oscillospiraceae]MCH1978282.1 hypothetical protein [Lawsonibacter sp. OA9]MCH1981832.1 hypothetical protein [Ruminococcus sp. OA3]
MKKSLPSVLNVGLPSILTIFLILSLVTFATLSLVTSRSQNQRAQQNAQRAESYGEASAAAEEKLAVIDRILYDSYHSLSVPEEETYFLNAMQTLAGISDITANRSSEGLLITYSIAVSDTQQLQAELLAVFPAETGTAFYRVLKWSTSPADTWNADDTLPVYGNNE